MVSSSGVDDVVRDGVIRGSVGPKYNKTAPSVPNRKQARARSAQALQQVTASGGIAVPPGDGAEPLKWR